MRKTVFIILILSISAMLFILWSHKNGYKESATQNFNRILSLAPAITETLYTLGLGENIVGVTRFCSWPPEARLKPKVGGFREINLEAIASTKADLVILPKDMEHYRHQIESLGMRVVLFDYSSLKDFVDDSLMLGQLTGKEEQAQKFTQSFMKIMNSKKNGNKPGILFALPTPDEYHSSFDEFTIIGSDPFYNEIIDASGGRNVYTGSIPYPRISLEALIAMQPDIIVIASPEPAAKESLKRKMKEMWRRLNVEEEKILILSDPGDTIPGPRSIGTIEKIESAIHKIARENN